MTWVYVPPCGQSTSVPAVASVAPHSRPAGSPAPSATSSASPGASGCSPSACEPATCCPRPSGMTCASSTGDPGVDAWISSLAAYPASPTPSPASNSETPTSAIFGPIFGGSFARFSPGSCSLRTYQDSLFTEEGCSEYSESLPPTGGMLSGRLYRLRTLAPITSASGCGLWPTQVQDGDRATNYAQGGRSLGATVRFATPNATDGKTGRSTTQGRSLVRDVQMWPSPMAGDATGSRSSKGKDRPDEGGLASAARKWPTPRAEDSEQTGGHRGTPDTLTSAARLWPRETFPTPTTPRPHDNDNTAGAYMPSQNQKDLASVVAQQGGSLNPTWVAWLMGWPLDWTDLPATSGGSTSQTCPGSPAECESESHSSSASAMAGCLTFRLTLLDAFWRGFWQRRRR